MRGGANAPKIRIPRRGNAFQSWSAIFVPCHKSQLKLKTTEGTATCKGKGGTLRSGSTKFEVNSNNINIQSDRITWKDGFQPKGVFCSY